MARLWQRVWKQVKRVSWAWSWQYNTPRFDPPPHLTRWRNRQAWSMFAIIMLWMGLPTAVLVFLGMVFPLMFLLQGLGWILFIAVSVGWLIAGNRMRMRLARARFQVCLNCGYSLRGLPERGCCPECGSEYELSRVRQVWRAYLWHKSRRRRASR